MVQDNTIRQFEFFKSFEKPVNYQQEKRNHLLNNCIGSACILLSSTMLIAIGSSLYNKQAEIHSIMAEEDKKIAKNLKEFVTKKSTNSFVVQTHNDCSRVMKGSAENINMQCEIYVLSQADNSAPELKLDKKNVYYSLQEFKKLSTYSPESTQKLNKLFSDLGVSNN